jgi:predicted enzyme related to lactoylglutathione lyase
MDAAIKRAEGAGAKLLRPVARTAEGLSYAFLTDPEGNQIELLK